MNPNVLAKIKATVKREGVYSNHPLDKGGPTKFGITEQTARAYGYNGDMKELSEELAIEIYYKKFWTAPKFDWVEPIDPILAERLFDWGVNSNPPTPVKYLQRILNVLNRQANDFADISADGLVGTETIYALREMVKKRGQDGLKVVRFMLQSQQSNFYFAIAERDATQETFEYGWQLNRAMGVE